MEIYQHRGSLARTLEAIGKGKLHIGFIGGSITDSRDAVRWPEYVISWFVENFPDTTICVENAAIGATGSDLAVFRAQRDLIDRECDLVFIEYAVNDSEEEADRRMRTREGLIRKLLRDGACDLVLVYTYRQEMYQDMMQGIVPESIRDFEKLGEHYGIGSVWMGLYALEEVKKGRMCWEEWLPDGLHPESRGSLSYAQSVIHYLEKELLCKKEVQKISVREEGKEPLHPDNWEHTELIPLEEIQTKGPWCIQRYLNLEWIDRVLCTSAVGATLTFAFTGRGLALGFAFGSYSAEFRYRIDEGEWQESVRTREEWCPEDNWFRIFVVTDKLPEMRHRFELEVIHGSTPQCKGTRFKLGFVGVIRENT